jgi:hypothetical protein
MGVAFESARAVLRDASYDKEIATKIIELAKAGERDPERLCDFMLGGLNKRKADICYCSALPKGSGLCLPCYTQRLRASVVPLHGQKPSSP